MIMDHGDLPIFSFLVLVNANSTMYRYYDFLTNNTSIPPAC